MAEVGAETSPRRHARTSSEEESILNARSLEAFSRKVTATAGHLMGSVGDGQNHYHNALSEIHRELRQPNLQRQIFALSQTSPRELVRSKLSVNEIQHRALTYLPDELLEDIPESNSTYSLFEGFQASAEEQERQRQRRHGRYGSRGRLRLEESPLAKLEGMPALTNLRNEKQSLSHRLEMLQVRKNMCSTEIREIDNKVSNLNEMRRVVLDRLADLEQEEVMLDQDMYAVDEKLEDMEEDLREKGALTGQDTPTQSSDADAEREGMDASFMSESIYQKLPTPKAKRRSGRRRTTFTLHEHLQSGSKIREFQAHNDTITAIDFDVPFGTMVTGGLDDTVRVWDLNAGRCMGLLEGHLSSVRCLQVEDNIVATGSMDASVRLWDLSQADYTSVSQYITQARGPMASPPEDEDEDDDFHDAPDTASTPLAASNMRDCPLFTLSAHVAEVTALHFHNSTLISGSADKTLRQWDIEKGRCVQTLDVLWASAQASSSINQSSTGAENNTSTMWRQSGRTSDSNADFVGALQCFDAALACGTADGMVRLWDLRSGQVHRSLVGHTEPITCLQFDDVHLVTGSADRSIRIWDLRTGSIVDAWGYANGITSMMFDARRIVAAAAEDVVKVYDKTDGRHWDCGAGADVAVSEEEVTGERLQGPLSTVEKVRIKDGYLIEGRRDGMIGVWSC